MQKVFFFVGLMFAACFIYGGVVAPDPSHSFVPWVGGGIGLLISLSCVAGSLGKWFGRGLAATVFIVLGSVLAFTITWSHFDILVDLPALLFGGACMFAAAHFFFTGRLLPKSSEEKEMEAAHELYLLDPELYHQKYGYDEDDFFDEDEPYSDHA